MPATRVRNKKASAPLRLVQFSVKGLFGLFDHEIPLSQKERYGKTVVLKLIAALFSEAPSTASLSTFSRYDFKTIVFEVSNGSKLRVSQTRRERLAQIGSPHHHRIRLSFELRRGTKRVHGPWSPQRAAHARMPFPLGYVEQRIPELTRVGFERWLLRSESVVLNLEEVAARFGNRAPFLQRIPEVDQPAWLVELRKAISCTLIETQRLTSQQPSERRPSDVRIVSRVQEFAQSLAGIMSSEVQKYATLSQSLDQTFPSRFLKRGATDALPNAQLKKALAELEISRKRLMDAGLLKQAGDEAMLSGAKLNAGDRELLTLYSADTAQKLGVFDEILAKIELFKKIINARFEFKTLQIALDRGFYFNDLRGRPLQLTDLSSGEQHELVLFYDLLFRAKPNSLTLLDEPEISLHIGWQRQFIPDLQQVLKLTPTDVLISTHSPYLAAGKLGLMVRLKAPKK
jgi:hypothetical protein